MIVYNIHGIKSCCMHTLTVFCFQALPWLKRNKCRFNYSRRGSLEVSNVFLIIINFDDLLTAMHFIHKAKVVITSNVSPVSAIGEVLPLKQTLDDAISACSDVIVEHILVLKRTDAKTFMNPGRDEWLEEVCYSYKICHWCMHAF